MANSKNSAAGQNKISKTTISQATKMSDLQILLEIGQVAVDNAATVRQHAIFRRALEDVPTRQQRQEGVADTEKGGKMEA